jgi:hypothetical protein
MLDRISTPPPTPREALVEGQEAHAGPTPMVTAMIFVPCAGGLSHNEAENALPSDLEAVPTCCCMPCCHWRAPRN